MKLFLTGGAGYVGSACLRYVLSRGHDALAYDNLREGHREAVPDGRLIVGDINDPAALTDAMLAHKPDAVMHFAAATYVGESAKDPAYYYRNNTMGSLSLLNAMRHAGVKRLLFSSTCSTYGDAPKCPMAEDAPQQPCNPYARTKLAVEWMIRDFAQAYGMGYTLLRYFNASGADPDGLHGEDHDPETHLIPLVLQVALGQRQKILVFGDDYPTPDGTCIRDYIHTNDLASAHLLAIEATTTKTADVFNIGTGNGQSVMEVIRTCEEVSGRKILYEVIERRPGDPPALVADSAKLQRQLGWKPQFPNIEGVVSTAWRWHESHPRGYRSTRVVESPQGTATCK